MSNVTYVDFGRNVWRAKLNQEIREIEAAHARGNLWFGCVMFALSMFAYSVFLFQVTEGDWKVFATFFVLSMLATPFLVALAIAMRYRVKHGNFGTLKTAIKDVVSDF